MKIAFRVSLYFIVLTLFWACKNDPEPRKYPQKSQKTKAKDTIPEVIIPAGGENDVDVSHIKTLTQETLEDYLEKYEIQNPESLVKVKTRFGDFKIQLFAAEKLHRVNFIRLTKLGYYDDTFFHRVDSGFVVQGGNSDKPSTQKLRSKIGDYLIPNEYNPLHKNNYGFVGMAKPPSQKVSNASSAFEFYIVVKKDGAHHLDKEFTVFGRVIEGMEVVEKISQVETDASEWPLSNIQMDIDVLR
ncbi:peptidylprolyl isomerase [Mesohalobacter halotolerans]|jgi:peptidylprolyl isomerase|uniref:Peptidyl-prolyl cis-trans isomerase n=1 Tax=Mesohalobacter halotolerans TaxID=1883405 RepID=A0A4U5TRM4_9FLAO|nr:peptidylprolyl isomerase [Mesohalobacter halotolerans]MBS3738726.1 peptidylprolyl isomerase [Psychroflexus sp.]NBC57019.1 peptidylprolyl isomerase [Bacteroidota bacterium]TKS56733.1 peptidylprolyl isomerase [Mesohalobacter halotolerans]